MQGSVPNADVALTRWRDRLESLTRQTESPRARRPRRTPLEEPRTIAEAASELGLSVHTVRAWVAARRMAHIRLGRAIRIPAAEVRRLIEENTVPAVKER
jgi:excisionase family DNA binding protein